MLIDSKKAARLCNKVRFNSEHTEAFQALVNKQTTNAGSYLILSHKTDTMRVITLLNV